MDRRAFLLGLLGGLTAASLGAAAATPSDPPSLVPQAPAEGTAASELSADDLDGVRTENAQYYRRRARRVYRRYYRRPHRRYRRRVRRHYRRGRWIYY